MGCEVLGFCYYVGRNLERWGHDGNGIGFGMEMKARKLLYVRMKVLTDRCVGLGQA